MMKSKDLAEGLAALAHETRIAICTALSNAGDEGMAGFELAERMGLSRTLVSHHLKILAQARLVVASRQGKTVVHQLDDKRMRRLSDAVERLSPKGA